MGWVMHWGLIPCIAWKLHTIILKHARLSYKCYAQCSLSIHVAICIYVCVYICLPLRKFYPAPL